MVLALALLFPALIASPPPADIRTLWLRAVPWQTFLDGVAANRQRWLQNWARADAPPDLAARLQRSGNGVEFLIVAEDWCTDSVNTVPYIVKLARAAGIQTRVLNRTAAAPLMDRHRAFDGRRVTPLVVVIRQETDVGAWVERPAVLQDLFRSMAADPDKAVRFGQRQTWYDQDAGRTTDREIVELVERSEVRH